MHRHQRGTIVGVATLFTVVLSLRSAVGFRRRIRAVPPPPTGGRDLVEPVAGKVRHAGQPVAQCDRVTCGPTTLVALRCRSDPAFAAGLLDNPDFAATFAAAQHRAHREANVVWPRRLGTTPWGMRRWLRRHRAGRYRVHLVNAADARDLGTALDQVAAAVDAGWAVPLLIGSALPRHWVLVLGTGPAGFLVFDPARGAVRSVPRYALASRALDGRLRYDDLVAVLVPVSG